MKKPAAPAKPKTDAPEGERIAKYLSRAGIASRREAERMIETGQVAVNGKVIDSPALNITAKDKITVNGKPVAPPEPARLWLYYKPEGLVTSASDEKGRETVFDHLPEDMPRVMSVGRLDLNSEGLLLLTNDGELKRRLELPSTGWLRKYRVRVKGNPTDPDLEPLRRGITVEGETFQPMQVVLDRHQGANAWLTVGLREGKNREIRRAMAEIGLTVNRLIRISYGPFRLNELQPGDVEEVRPKVLRDQLGLTGDEGDDAPARRMTRTTSRKADDAAPRRSVPAGGTRPAKAGAPRWLDEDEGPKRPIRRTSDAPRGRGSDRPDPADDKPAPRRFGTSAARKEDASRGRSAAPAALSDRSDAKPSPRKFGTSAARDEDAPRGRGTAAAARSDRSDAKPAARKFGTSAPRREDGDTPRPARGGTKSFGTARRAVDGDRESHAKAKPPAKPASRPAPKAPGTRPSGSTGGKPRPPRKG